MPGTKKRLAGPTALSTSLTTNLYQGGGGSALLYDIITHIHIVNKTGNTIHFSIWLGATGANAAGTELFISKAIAANDVFDWYTELKLTSTDFLVGGADTATAAAIVIEGEQYAV